MKDRSRVNLYELWPELPFRMQRDEISKSKSVSRSSGEHTRAELKELVAHSENQLMHRVAQVVRLEHAERNRRGAEVPEGDRHVVMQQQVQTLQTVQKNAKACEAQYTFSIVDVPMPKQQGEHIGDQRQDCRYFKDHLTDRSDGDFG